MIGATSAPTEVDMVDETPEVEEGGFTDQDQEVQSETPTTTAPLQDIDPLAELEKLEQLDPKVKEALKAGFLRQADYTKKTQDISEARKAAESYKQWQPVIEFLSQNPKIADSIFGAEKKQTTQEDELPDDPKEFARVIREQAKAETIAELRKEMAMEKEINDASSLDPRLQTDEFFSQQIAGYINLNLKEDILNGRISVKDATQKALDAHKAYEEGLRQKVLADINEKAKKKTMVMPAKNGSPLGTTSRGGRMSIAEAAALADEQLSK